MEHSAHGAMGIVTPLNAHATVVAGLPSSLAMCYEDSSLCGVCFHSCYHCWSGGEESQPGKAGWKRGRQKQQRGKERKRKPSHLLYLSSAVSPPTALSLASRPDPLRSPTVLQNSRTDQPEQAIEQAIALVIQTNARHMARHPSTCKPCAEVLYAVVQLVESESKALEDCVRLHLGRHDVIANRYFT